MYSWMSIVLFLLICLTGCKTMETSFSLTKEFNTGERIEIELKFSE